MRKAANRRKASLRQRTASLRRKRLRKCWNETWRLHEGKWGLAEAADGTTGNDRGNGASARAAAAGRATRAGNASGEIAGAVPSGLGALSECGAADARIGGGGYFCHPGGAW